MEQFVSDSDEFFEVLNAFPHIKKWLLEQKFNLSDVPERQSLHDYFSGKNYSESEISILVRKINIEMNLFFKNPKNVEQGVDNVIYDDDFENDDIPTEEEEE